MYKLRDLGIVALLLAISGVPRFVGLGRFTSIDEPFWLRQSGNFYYALGQREFQNTLYEYHPAVTTMWIIAGGMLMYFPEYRALGQGYLKPGKFDEFMVEHGKSMLELLVSSRGIQVVVILIMLVLLYFLLRALFDRGTAFFAATFVSLSPFFMGHSRLLNHEAMVGLFCVVSLVGMLAYLQRSRNLIYLLASGAAAGLAQLTKSSAIPIIGLIALMLGVHALSMRGHGKAMTLLPAGKTFGLWLGILAAIYIIAWPGMWVAPLDMLQDVYGNAVSYALQGARTSVTPDIRAQGFNLAGLLGGVGVYLNDLLWRTTPLTALGVIAGLFLAARRGIHETQGVFRYLVSYCLLLGAAFVLLFGIQRSPKAPHYILTTYVALDLVAGLGLAHALALAAKRTPSSSGWALRSIALGVLLVIQMWSSASAFPYYISYYNPIVEAIRPGVQNPTLNETGYGVGLDQAAGYLAGKPGAQDMVVLAAHGLGSFSYYFPGRTVAMNNFSMTDPQVAQIVPDTDYVVVDYYNHKRKGIYPELVGITPEKAIWINGIEFLRIYPSAVFLTGPGG